MVFLAAILLPSFLAIFLYAPYYGGLVSAFSNDRSDNVRTINALSKLLATDHDGVCSLLCMFIIRQGLFFIKLRYDRYWGQDSAGHQQRSESALLTYV